MMQTELAHEMKPSAKREKINCAICLMVDAIEGPAIAYWAEAKNIKRDASLNVISFDVRDGGYEGGRQSAKWVRVTEAKVRKAAKALLNGEADIERQIAAQFVRRPDEFDADGWDYDVDGTDCLIQFICFGKVIFG